MHIVGLVHSLQDAATIGTAISEFIASCALPALLEHGEAPIPLLENHFQVEVSRKGAWLQAWDARRMWSRRILAAATPNRQRLELSAFRFGKKPVRVTLVDVGDSRSAPALEKVQRSAFSEKFRLFLNRHFGSWRWEAFHAEANLEHSHSPLYPTALCTRGQEAVASLGAPPRDTGFHSLTFALIWLDWVRRWHGEIAASRLLLYLPEAHAAPVIPLARRLRLSVDIWLYREDGVEYQLDPADSGNLDSRLALRHSRLAGPAWWLELLAEFPEVDSMEEPDGGIGYRIRGLEVARLRPALPNAVPQLLYGLKRRQKATPDKRAAIRDLFLEVSAARPARPSDRLDPRYLAEPERWLESALRRNLQEIDPSLTGEAYSQILGSHAGERSAADILAIDSQARLAVLELKASEDIHLPLQAFDYWLRISLHLGRGEFRDHGYFPGRVLSPLPPRLFLVAPALHFHPSTAAVLSFLPPDCPVTRIGLNADWRQRIDCVLRM